MKPVKIRPFSSSDSDSVNDLIRGIQKTEFKFTENNFPQPELGDIKNFYISSGGNFWVACLDNPPIVGTAAILNLGNGIAKLGKMFVHPAYRGRPLKIAQKLLDTAMGWARSIEVKQVYFETTPEPCTAHYFYCRNEFIEVKSNDFPSEYELCPYPSRYFMKSIS